MAALEHRVLTKILREQSLQPALKVGLSEEQFKDPEARQIWRFLLGHWYNRATAKTVPTIEAIQRRWPSFRTTAELDEADIGALLHDLKCISFETDTRSLASYFQELVDEDPHEAVRAMQNHLTNLVMRFSDTEHLGVREVLESAMEHYEAAQEGTIFGIPWPWDCLTRDTLGKNPGDFIVFYARMKQMKTWVMLHCAVYDYIVNHRRVLIWSREMNKKKMCLRVAALMAKVDYQLFKKGKLPPKVYARLRKTFQKLLDEDAVFQAETEEQRAENARLGKRQLILMCGREAPIKLESVQGHIQEYCPDIVYLDSWYHLECSRMEGVRQRNSRLAILAEDVKSMAEDEEIPVVAVHQANRYGEKTHGETMVDLADTDVLAREADLIARIIKRQSRELYEEEYEVATEQEKAQEASRPKAGKPKLGRPTIGIPKKAEKEAQRQEEEEEEEEARLGTELAIVLPGNREGVLNAFTIKAIPGYNFEFISSDYSLAQIEEWVSQDKDDSDKAPKASSKKHAKPQFNQETFKNYRGPPDGSPPGG